MELFELGLDRKSDRSILESERDNLEEGLDMGMETQGGGAELGCGRISEALIV